jgi:hypothetical protein
VARFIAERYAQMPPEERVLIASGTFDSASVMIHSTLPSDLPRPERRLAWLRRFYEGDVPEKTLIAVAEWEPPST